MKLASTIHPNSIQIHFNFDFNLLKSSSVTCPKTVPGRFVLRRSQSLLSVPSGRAVGRKRSPIARDCSAVTCARRIDREQETSSSPKEASRCQSPEGIDGNESSCDDTSSAISVETDSTSSEYATSLRTVGLCVFSAVAFGVGLGFKDGTGKASEFFAGYLLEQSLSVDNLFVFVLIFKYFKVPLNCQNRVLSYGIAGAVVFRLSLILLGTATLERFEAVNLLLAAVLLYSSFKLFAENDEDTDLLDNFIVKTCQRFIPVTWHRTGRFHFNRNVFAAFLAFLGASRFQNVPGTRYASFF